MNGSPLEQPTLVVMTGLPGSGKTTLTNYLVDHHRFAAISRDALRSICFRQGFSAWQRYQNGAGRRLLDEVVDQLKELFLTAGRYVVVDSVAPSEEYRIHHLFRAQPSNVRRCLVWLEADRKDLNRRLAERGDAEALAYWESRWTDPRPGRGYDFLSFRSGTADEQLEAIEMISRYMDNQPCKQGGC
jgi:predicted kinase